MKIIVAGGGIGGLFVAGLLSKQGHDVTLYERSESLDKMRYDWHDDVNPKVFSECGIVMPESSFPKSNWTFVAPDNESKFRLVQRYDYIDYSVDRKELNRILYSMIGDTKVVFGTTVTKAICSNGKVVGANVTNNLGSKTRVFCDLLVDACGVFSCVRQSIDESMNIPQVSKEETFCAYRAFFNRTEASPRPKETNKVYMKHLGKNGISWCILDEPSDTVNVLVGRVGELSKETVSEALAELRKDNKILGTEVVRGGQTAIIPVRRPLSKIVADGYVAIGDSACMTVPLIGSGIATSLISAKILAEVIEKNGSASEEALWEYQYGVYKKFGAEHCGIEVMKNWMLEQPPEIIAWFFTSGILNNKDLQNLCIGKMLKITLSEYLYKGWVGLDYPSVLAGMLKVLINAKKAIKIADSIPKEYNVSEIKAWQKKLDRFYLYIK